MKKYIAAMIYFYVETSQAGEITLTKDRAAIEEITNSIPAKGGSFADRARSLGITVISITTQHVDAGEAAGDPFSRAGDISYSINTDANKSERGCDVLGTADITKRNGKYILESRTANWIVKGLCSAP
jgi:hypothetical protein